MSVSDKLKTDVAAKNLAAIRDDLWSRIALDPNFTGGFLESWQYCLDNGIDESKIYQEHDGRDIDLEPTGENFDLLGGQLRTNFSKERLDKMKEIGRKLYPVKDNEYGDPDKKKDRFPLFVGGAIAGGAIGAAIFGKAVAAATGAVIGATAGAVIGPIVRAAIKPTIREWIGQKLSKK